MQYLFIFIGILLLSSCGKQAQRRHSPEARQTAERAMAGWKNAKRAFEVDVEGLSKPEVKAVSRIGVYANLKDATHEESDAFKGAAFTKKGNGNYLADDRNAVTTDSAARLYVCYPYRKGLKAQDTVLLKAPLGEFLYGKEIQRKYGQTVLVKMNMLSATALLRITCKSNDVQDRLDDLSIAGDEIYTRAKYMPYMGKWLEMTAESAISAPQTDCQLNNGRLHDFCLIPTETAGMITIFTKINQKPYVVKTTLPPLRAGSLTQINLWKSDNELKISSSWVDTRHPIVCCNKALEVDTVKVGYYLQRGGYISNKRDTSSIALVIQTDGKHGKAVALEDCEGKFCFGSSFLSSGKTFSTIDGKRKEGVVNPKQSQEIGDVEKIIFKPGIPYGKSCAFGYANGAELTTLLIRKSKKGAGSDMPHSPHTGLALSRKLMLDATQRHPGSYVPSLAEMAELHYQLRSNGISTVSGKFAIPHGEYLTSSESDCQTFYMIDMEQGAITGICSKQYAKMQLRLFYLF